MGVKELIRDFEYYYEMYRYSELYYQTHPLIFNDVLYHSITLVYSYKRLFIFGEEKNRRLRIEPRGIEKFIQKTVDNKCGVCYAETPVEYICCPICFNHICGGCAPLEKCPYCRSNNIDDEADLFNVGGLRVMSAYSNIDGIPLDCDEKIYYIDMLYATNVHKKYKHVTRELANA